MAKEKYNISIWGRDYELFSELPPLLVDALRRYLDERLRETEESIDTTKGEGIEPSRIAVLTALKITADLFNTEENYENLILTLDKKIDEMLVALDKIDN
ncbi:MAG: cell division protein ZapA [Elusimicrobiota bacterium]